jgi:hypothetical protein
MQNDVNVIHIGDMHSGGLTALYPSHPMTFELDKKNTRTVPPNPYQRKLNKHFLKGADVIREASNGMRKIIVHNGDAIDGYHHGSMQYVVTSPKEQSKIHIDLMETFLDRVGFSLKNGDELHYVSGTETHTGWEEYGIAEAFNHLEAKYWDDLRLTVNGVRLWWTHQGPKPGKGINEGNPLRNFARDIYFDCKEREKVKPPHLITTSHFHKSSYDSWNLSYDHTVHIQVLPSWQGKTRYGIKASPFQRNDIGYVWNVITAGGDIRFNRFIMDDK